MDTVDIPVSELTVFEVAPDGSAVRMGFRTCGDRAAALVLPAECVQQLVMTVPGMAEAALQRRHRDSTLRLTYPVGTWRVEQSQAPGTLILTLETIDGFKVSFAVGRTIVSDIADGLRDAAESPEADFVVARH